MLRRGENLFPEVFMNFLLAEGDELPKAKEELVSEYKKLDEALGKVTKLPFRHSFHCRSVHAEAPGKVEKCMGWTSLALQQGNVGVT